LEKINFFPFLNDSLHFQFRISEKNIIRNIFGRMVY